MLQLKTVKKDYVTAGSTVQALRGVSLEFRANEFVSIDRRDVVKRRYSISLAG